MQLLIPGGYSPAANLDVSFNSFSNLMNHAIGPEYVPDISNEIPPGVMVNPYPRHESGKHHDGRY